jgi:ribosomal protein S18 acetylase RimI-like enzyme
MFLWWENDDDHTYRDIDFEDERHITCIRKLCERNTFYVDDIYWFVHQSTPLENILDMEGVPTLHETTVRYIKRNQEAIKNWIPRGLFTMKGNKVVGFILYSIHRETKQELELNFLLVDKDYRKQHHGSNLLRVCEQRHCFKIKYEEIGASYYEDIKKIKKGEFEKTKELLDKITILQTQNDSDYRCNQASIFELVDYITTNIKRDEHFDTAVRFYKKNGFIDLNHDPKWREILPETNKMFLTLVRVGPVTSADISAQDIK